MTVGQVSAEKSRTAFRAVTSSGDKGRAERPCTRRHGRIGRREVGSLTRQRTRGVRRLHGGGPRVYGALRRVREIVRQSASAPGEDVPSEVVFQSPPRHGGWLARRARSRSPASRPVDEPGGANVSSTEGAEHRANVNLGPASTGGSYTDRSVRSPDFRSAEEIAVEVWPGAPSGTWRCRFRSAESVRALANVSEPTAPRDQSPSRANSPRLFGSDRRGSSDPAGGNGCPP